MDLRPTARVTGGWGGKSSETGNCQSSEQSPKNAQSPSRPVHAVLGVFGCARLVACEKPTLLT